MPENNISTKLQHTGKERRVGTGLVSATEISVTFQSPSATDTPIYSRLGNTSNHMEVEAVLKSLHGADDAIVTGSGMASFTLILMTLLKPGDHVIVQDACYGGTYNLLTKVFQQWDIESSFVKIEDWDGHRKQNTKMVIFESITNPFCVPQNIGTAVAFAKRHALLSVCDNTFASPTLCRPLLHGADLVLESATKYLNGHSDVIAGVVAGRKELMTKLRPPHAYIGTFLPTYQCSQLLRGLRTLELRMEKHCASGKAFADAMGESEDLVAEVSYGAPNGGPVAEFFSAGYGGMVSVRFTPKVNVKKLMTTMSLVTNVPSLGGTESTATMPSYSTNWFMTPDEKAKYKIDDQLVRFSIGLENVMDIIKDVLHSAANARY